MPNRFETVTNFNPDTDSTSPTEVINFARDKTLFIADAYRRGNLIVEASNTGNPGQWVQVARYSDGRSLQKLDLLCRYLRVNPSSAPGVPAQSLSAICRVAAQDESVTISTLNVPSNGATGTELDTSEMGAVKHIICAGTGFNGRYEIEGLVGGVPELLGVFTSAGIIKLTGIHEAMRVKRSGSTLGGNPSITLASADELGGAASPGGTSRTMLVQNGGSASLTASHLGVIFSGTSGGESVGLPPIASVTAGTEFIIQSGTSNTAGGGDSIEISGDAQINGQSSAFLTGEAHGQVRIIAGDGQWYAVKMPKAPQST